jgi:uncharacterized MAPEG superfamily protein
MLVWSAVLCVVMFLPYVLARVMTWGLTATVGYPVNPPPLPAWAQRAQRVHLNMVENLLPFAILVLVAQDISVSDGVTATGATLFFWARVVHTIVFIAGIPWARTFAFLAGVVGMAMILAQILAKAYP